MSSFASPALAATRRDPVLIVDDDEKLRGMVRFALQQGGYRVEEAASVGEARALLRTRLFSLILCDQVMPGGTGLDLLAFVAERHPEIPFVMLTGCETVELAASAIQHGALDFLAKPFEFGQLARILEQNWARVEWNRAQIALGKAEVLTGTIRALVAAIDAKEPHTAHHSTRVGRLALQLGAAVGLDPERMHVLEFAALLHDVGKIALPDAVLLKAGKPTDKERAKIKEHPACGAALVAQVQGLEEVASIIRHHHERFDGGGYPEGLTGEAIPYLSRIITVADVYEALTADRSYRSAMSIPDARKALLEGLGGQFDPELGATFLRIPTLA